MSNVSELKRCPKCGGPISAEAPQGLCPKCLLQQACVSTEAGKGESAKAAPPTLEELAAAFPQLEILQLIGQGGMGFVFKARQPTLDRFVALKILPQSLAADPAFAERFTREGRMLARLNHPNIVALYEFGRAELPLGPNIGAAQQRSPTGPTYFFLMEYVDGVNLRQAMKVGRFTPAQALSIVPKICEALQFAHNEGILHRDIKPENILLDTKGRVKIADFGIAKMIGSEPGRAELPLSPGIGEQHSPTGIIGTPQYMAPEQLEHPQDVDQRADIYSLGVVFYEMLTGELPLGHFAPPSEKSAVDPRVDEVVLRALEKERERRQNSAGEVRAQVETIAATAEPGSSRREEAQLAKPNAEWGKRMPLLSPFQSAAVRDICAHLIKAESNGVSMLGLLFGVWIVGTTFGLPVLIRSYPSPGNWILALVWGILFVVSLPMLLQLQRQFLCSTTWAKNQGFTPEQLRLFSFHGKNLWKGLGVFLVLLLLVFAQHKAITRYLGLSELTPLDPVRKRQQVEPAAQLGKTVVLSGATNPFPASAETWSPVVEPRRTPDLQKILDEAKGLMSKGAYEEALQRHIWYHNHALEIDPGQTGVRLSSALSDWMELGRRYPKAKQALIDLRDSRTREFLEGRGYGDMFQEIANINRELQNNEATYALFKTIYAKDRKLAQECYFYVEDLLVAKGEYQLCLSWMGDPQRRFSLIHKNLEMGWESQKRMNEIRQKSAQQMAEFNRKHGRTNTSSPPDTSEIMKEFSNDRFIGSVCQLVEILVGTGHQAEAENIRDQAIAILDDARLKSSVDDAAKKARK